MRRHQLLITADLARALHFLEPAANSFRQTRVRTSCVTAWLPWTATIGPTLSIDTTPVVKTGLAPQKGCCEWKDRTNSAGKWDRVSWGI
jgi:hypothetical protein